MELSEYLDTVAAQLVNRAHADFAGERGNLEYRSARKSTLRRRGEKMERVITTLILLQTPQF